jgi:hypothetical protein
MSTFKVTKHFKNIPTWQQTGARIQLTHWLKKEGHRELAGNVCAASSNAALSPHLAEVDKVLPTEITREQIFPKVFTDPLTIRHELTAMIGQSVRRYPKGSTEGEFSVEDRIAILSALKDQIEEEGKRSKFTKEIDRFLKSDREAKDFEDKLDALVIEAGGYLTGLNGTQLDETIVDVTKKDAEKVVDANIYGALSFLDLVGRQEIQASGYFKPIERDAAKRFLLGAGKVWRTTPRFVDALSTYWGRATSERIGEASDDLSANIGLTVSQITEPRLKLGIAARLSKARIIFYLHLLEVEKFIYARGWLKGYAEHNEGKGAGEWVSSLRKNVPSALERAIQIRNPGYVIRVAKAMPIILEAFEAKAKELDDNLASILLSNKASAINHAVKSGKLESYPEMVFKALPEMVDAIRTKAEELDEELAKLLISNKRSMIFKSIQSGKLERYLQEVFEALPKMVDSIAAEAEEMDDELAKVLLSNRATIIYYAINAGTLEKYPRAIFEALPKMVDSITVEAENLDKELAEVLLSNKATIISHAIVRGKLKNFLLKILEALPKIVDAIEAKAKELDDELAAILLSNKATIIYRALVSRKFEKYPQVVFKALPRMADAIEAKAKELENELADVLLTNKATIISSAISRGGAPEKRLQIVLEALPKMVDAIEAKAEEVGDELAKVLLSNKATIINYSLRTGKLEKYPQDVFEALPRMVYAITAKAEEMDEEFAEILLSNKATIINRAIKSGEPEKYVEAVCEVLPRMAQTMDRGEIHRAIHSGNIDV